MKLRNYLVISLMTLSTALWAQEDKTSLIQNPSFENNGTAGWTVNNMQTQSNSVFSRKAGTYYIESWVGIGSKIGNASVVQTLKKLPQGNYRLTAAALHIQQSGSGSTTNSGTAQKGAYIVAGNSQVAVTSMKQYTLNFSVLEEEANIEIGLIAKDATGNYLCVDNFQLKYMGEITPTDYAAEVQRLVEKAQSFIELGIQNTVATTLTEAIEAAQTALQGTGTDGEGNTTYDETALAEARTALLAGITKAEASRALYDALHDRID